MAKLSTAQIIGIALLVAMVLPYIPVVNAIASPVGLIVTLIAAIYLILLAK